MIAPRRKELAGDLIILVLYKLLDEGKQPLSNLIPNRGDIKESCADWSGCDPIINYLGNSNPQNFPNVPVKEHF